MAESRKIDDRESRRRRGWILLALLLIFACVFFSTFFALLGKAVRVIPAGIVANAQANYGGNPGEPAFGPLDPEIIIKATRDAESLLITPLLGFTGTPSVSSRSSSTAENSTREGTPMAFGTAIPMTASPSETSLAFGTLTLVPSTTGTNFFVSNTPTQFLFANTPTPSRTVVPTTTPSRTTTRTLTPSAKPPTATLAPSRTKAPPDTQTPSRTPTHTQTSSLTPSGTWTPSNTPSITSAPSMTPSATATSSNTPTPSDTPTSTATATQTFTPSPSSTPTSTQTPTSISRFSITPILDCVQPVPPMYRARFTYDNPNTFTVTIAIGINNRFIPPPVNRGQPTMFQSGSRPVFFTVDFDGSPLTWELDGSLVIADSTSPLCP